MLDRQHRTVLQEISDTLPRFPLLKTWTKNAPFYPWFLTLRFFIPHYTLATFSTSGLFLLYVCSRRSTLSWRMICIILLPLLFVYELLMLSVCRRTQNICAKASRWGKEVWHCLSRLRLSLIVQWVVDIRYFPRLHFAIACCKWQWECYWHQWCPLWSISSLSGSNQSCCVCHSSEKIASQRVTCMCLRWCSRDDVCHNTD